MIASNDKFNVKCSEGELTLVTAAKLTVLFPERVVCEMFSSLKRKSVSGEVDGNIKCAKISRASFQADR